MFKPKGVVALDSETTGVLPFNGDAPFAVSMCDPEGETWYTEWPVDPCTRQVHFNDKDVAYIAKILQDRKVVKPFFNLKFDLRQLSNIPALRPLIQSLIDDQATFQQHFREVFFMAKICFSQEPEGGYGLKALSKKYAGIDDADEDRLKEAVVRARSFGSRQTPPWKLNHYGKDPKLADYWMIRLWDPSNNACEEYARLDAVRTLVLHELYWDVINNPNAELYDTSLLRTYTLEMEVWPVVWGMEGRGMSISRKANHREWELSKQRANSALQEIRRITGKPDFNPDSYLQLGPYLFGPKEKGGLGLEIKKMAKKGPSCDVDALREHLDHPFVQLVMNYRSANKGSRDFFGKYDWMMVPHEDPEARRRDIYTLHPNINQIGPVTGRTSSSDPNLQQVGDATKQYRGVNPIQARGPFCPTPGYVVYGFDWSGQEGRIFADLADIPEMLEAAFAGRDINTELANRVWGGKGNPAAIKAMAQALELGRDEPTSQAVLDAWKSLGWNRTKARQGVYSTEAFVIAEAYLRAYDYRIVEAEKSLGKSASRGRGKTTLFSQMYGGGPNAITGLLYCTLEEAKEWRDDLHRAIPGIKPYMRSLMREARQNGCIYTAFGRRINVDPEFAYKCVDYKVQGTAADMLKRAMKECNIFFQRARVQAYQLMPIHDEILFEIKKGHNTKIVLREIKRIMENTYGCLRVPMLVEANRYATSWARPTKGVI
jgi:DNA polymerase I-like protein with 3'-5' exonuclease and polymerase domains